MNIILCVSDREPAQSILPFLKEFLDNYGLNLKALVSEKSYYQKLLEFIDEEKKPFYISNSNNNEDKIIATVRKLNIDFLISIQYRWILSSRVIESVNGRAFNFHYGKLPDYRGHHLAIHAILNQEKKFSTTCHWMIEKVDRGGEESYFENYPWGNIKKILNEDCPWHQKFYQFKYPFIRKYDGNIKHCLIDYSK